MNNCDNYVSKFRVRDRELARRLTELTEAVGEQVIKEASNYKKR